MRSISWREGADCSSTAQSDTRSRLAHSCLFLRASRTALRHFRPILRCGLLSMDRMGANRMPGVVSDTIKPIGWIASYSFALAAVLLCPFGSCLDVDRQIYVQVLPYD